jgi:hypothetical protein
MMCAQPTAPTSLKQPSPSSQEEVINVTPPTSALEVVKELTMSSSTSTTLEKQLVSPPEVNYFTNLLSDSDESGDEFDPYTISCPSNSIDNSLPHSRTLHILSPLPTFLK